MGFFPKISSRAEHIVHMSSSAVTVTSVYGECVVTFALWELVFVAVISVQR